jgi:regulatory protein
MRKGRAALSAGSDGAGGESAGEVAGDSACPGSRDETSLGSSDSRHAGGLHNSSPSRRFLSRSSSSNSVDPLAPFDASDLANRRHASVAVKAGSGSENAEPPICRVSGNAYTRSRQEPSALSEPQERSKKPVRSLRARALGYLSRREYSRIELSRKLSPFAEEADVLEALLNSLESEGWLSDSRFVESVIHRRAARVGASRIVNELRRHVVGDALIEEVSAQLRETELMRAQAVWRKKYGQLPETPVERARQARFLAMRGFSHATIAKILKGIDDDWGEV